METCFRPELKTRSDSACPWPAPAVAETCSNCCARKKADRHLLLLLHTVCTPLSGRGVIWVTLRRDESVSFSCSEQSLIYFLVVEFMESLDQRFSNWGPRTKGGPQRLPTGSARRFRKVVIICTVFNNLRPICFQICKHKSVSQSQCIAWKCCRGSARQAFC